MWFGTSEPDDSKGALPYDTYNIEELRSDSNKGFELIPPFEIVVWIEISFSYSSVSVPKSITRLFLDTYIIEELRSDSNKGFKLISPFEIVVSRNNLVIDLGTLTDEYEKEISIHTTATKV